MKINEKTGLMIRVALIIIFLCMFVIGYHTKELNIVMMKAQNICMECIGIG